ncbi:unnamed protein product [Coregonus sp. 'balchen']|nr:unnamed protein product [Coregonus sp. 'balchen']
MVMFFHFSSLAFPPRDGPFNGHVKWLGSPGRGLHPAPQRLPQRQRHLHLLRQNPPPPDVRGFPTSQTVLTVTPKVLAVSFLDVAVLLAFILLPSAIIALALLGRMCCPPKDKSQAQGFRL